MIELLRPPLLLAAVWERLAVASTEEIWLEERHGSAFSSDIVARSRSAMVHVDRPLAVRLRVDGARWNGDPVRDPCAVA